MRLATVYHKPTKTSGFEVWGQIGVNVAALDEELRPVFGIAANEIAVAAVVGHTARTNDIEPDMEIGLREIDGVVRRYKIRTIQDAVLGGRRRLICAR